LWFTENMGNRIGRITTDGSITEYALLVPSGPLGIQTGPDSALWFVEQGGSVGRITTHGEIDDYRVPTSGSEPWGIAKGPDGAMWFTEQFAEKIGRISVCSEPHSGPDGRCALSSPYPRIGNRVR
jgi:virginiamycin B lyase